MRACETVNFSVLWLSLTYLRGFGHRSWDSKTRLDEFVDEVVKSGKNADELLQDGGLLKDLFKRVAERALEAEMSAHLGCDKHAVSGRGSCNSSNGRGRKRVLSERPPTPHFQHRISAGSLHVNHARTRSSRS